MMALYEGRVPCAFGTDGQKFVNNDAEYFGRESVAHLLTRIGEVRS